MKNLVLTASVSRLAGGLFYSVRRLHQTLSELGVPVEVHGLRDPSSAEDVKQWEPLTVAAHTRDLPIDPLGFSSSLRRACRAWADDSTVIHLHGLWMYPSKVCLNLSEERGLPRVLSPRGMLDSWALKNSQWRKRVVGLWFERRNLRGAACLHALCDSERKSIRNLGLTGPVAVIPNGVDVPEAGANATGTAFRAANGSAEKRVLLYLGRLHPKKGLENLVRGWHLVNRDGAALLNGWTLVIAGWDQHGHEAELRELAAELELKEAVLFVGPRFEEERDALYRSASAFVLPSLSEGLPMTVLEAWANSLPVLMTPECNLPEGFASGAATPIAASPKGVALGLRQLIDMPDSERRAAGMRGRDLVRAKFAWPVIAADMKAVYDWVLGGGAVPDCVRKDE